jgi:DNA-binding PadR family transcriptional regulator
MNKTSQDTGECEDIRKPHTIPRGLLRMLIIRMLHSHEMTGTEMMDHLAERSQGDWKPSPGSIYPLLASLEEDGIIEPVKTEGRSKTYRIAPGERERTKIILKRHDVEHKARLGRMMWLQLLEPVDRIHLHFGGIRFALDSMDDTIDSLSKSELRKVQNRLKKARDKIDTLLERINKGETKND